MPVDIAIVGAGIAGVMLALACKKFDLPVTVYESAPKIWQHGSGLGFQPNAINAINAIEPELAKALEEFYSQKPGQKADIIYCFGQDNGDKWKAFDEILTLHTDGVKTVSRANIMECLLRFVPESSFSFNKHLVSLEDSGDKVKIHFRDGTTAEHDIVIGTDGVHSHTRQHIADFNEDSVPRFTGKVVHRTVIKADDCRDLVGNSTEGELITYVGYHGHVLMIPINHGAAFSVTCFGSRQEWTDDRHWELAATDVDLAKDYRTWSPKIQHMLDKAGQTDVWAIFDLPYVRHYARGGVAIVGDAAHASSPFQGNGSAIAFEDACILSTLLAQAGSSVPDAKVALQVYDELRRPRAQKQIHTAMETGLVLELEHHMVLDDIDAFKKRLSSVNKWLWSFDAEKEMENARKILARRLGQSS